MIECSYCQHPNEDGAIFCEKCKSDLAAGPIPLQESPESSPAPVGLESPSGGEPSDGFPGSSEIPQAVPLTPMEAGVPVISPEAGVRLPRLVVVRGVKPNVEFPLFEGENFIGRTDEKPVDVDLEEQESPDRIWSSRQHACIHIANGVCTIEDLNSSNGTFVNRARVHPGEKHPLSPGDVIQIGTVHLKVVE